MFNLISKKKLLKRVGIFLIIVISFIFNTYIFQNNEEMLTHYKPYYLLSYAYAMEHRLASGGNNVVEGRAKSIPVLIYHGISNDGKDTSTRIEDFKKQMFDLKAEGYQTIHIDDFNKYIKGEKELPYKSFLLTFDDGRKDAYYPVEPILEELNYSAVMFVITGTLGLRTSGYHLTTEELLAMKRSGHWDIEVHTHNGHGLVDTDDKGGKGHFYSNKIWLKDLGRLETDEEYKKRIDDDLISAKNELKRYLGIDATAFAFPFGDFGQEPTNYQNSVKILNEETSKFFSLAFHQSLFESGYSYNYPKKDIMINRISVDSYIKGDQLIKVIQGGEEKNAPINISKFEKNQGWLRMWGSLSFKKDHLILRSNEESNGATVLLDGTKNMSNIKISTEVDWTQGTKLTYIFNVKDPNNYQFFEIERDKVAIGYCNSGTQVIYQTKPIVLKTATDHNINYSVAANRLSLEIDGENILSNIETQGQPEGGIGFQVWDDKVENAEATILNLIIEKII